MTNLNKNNIFLLNLGFGYNSINKIVIAKNIQEAINTIKDYYEDPEIKAAISLEKLDELIQKLNNDKINIVFEYMFEDNQIKINEYERLDATFEILEKEYENRTCLIVNRQILLLSVGFIFEEFKNHSEMIIVADSLEQENLNFTN